MTSLNLEQFSTYLQQLNFNLLFTDALGWNHPPASERAWKEDAAKDINYRHRMVAELSGVAVLEIVTETGWPDETHRNAIWKQVSQSHYENLLIFVDRAEKPTQSLWYWVKRTKDTETGKPKNIPRRHEYFRGQPVDLFASKLQAMVVELYELDATGRLPVLEVARRMESALDVEKTTKRFFTAYQEQHGNLLAEIEGIDDERDRRWYASVILNRLMFVWFMQKKGFLDHADYDYLPKKFAASQTRGLDRFFGEFLSALFFEAFAKPKTDRAPAVQTLTGDIPYLNGGLFLHHTLELDANKQPRLGTTLRIATRAARLICTTPEFDDLAKEVGLKHHQPLEPLGRARLRAELDGLIAHLYGLTEAEFTHILTTFPLVTEPVKVAALNAYRDVERGMVK